MYLIERLISLFIYVSVLIIICFLISRLGRKYLGKILSIYVFLLATMAFFFIPPSGADLYRLIPIMHIFANLSFSELWQSMLHSTNPVYLLYMNLIGRTKIDGLLPAITALLFYKNVFYILKKSVIRSKVTAHDSALVLFFFMSIGALIEVISGIRTMLGFSFIAVFIYKEMVEGKSIYKNVLWYIVVSLLHPAVFALTVIRFTYLLFEKSSTKYKQFSKLLIMICSAGILFFFGKEYFMASFEKGKHYIMSDSYSYFWEYVIGGICLLLILNIEFITSKLIKIEGDTGSIQNLLGFCKFLSVILIIISIEYNTFHRFVIFLTIMAIPLLANILKSSNYKKVVKINFKQLVFIISFILLLLATSRGNLTSLKFFIL